MAFQVVLEHLETHLVSIFEGPVILGVLLDRVVGQVHVLVVWVVRVDAEL